MTATVIGIDLAKNVFQLHGVDAKGRIALKQRLRRAQLLPFVAQLPTATIGIEACAGAFHWAREFERYGHTVRIISPQFVKPFITGTRTTGTMPPQSARPSSGHICASCRRRASSSRMCRHYTGRDSAW